MSEDKRQSGRTTRMVIDAVDAATAMPGRSVVIVYMSAMRQYLWDMLTREVGYRANVLEVSRNLNSVHFDRLNRIVTLGQGGHIRMVAAECSIQNMIVNRRYRVFVDHAAWDHLAPDKREFVQYWHQDSYARIP